MKNYYIIQLSLLIILSFSSCNKQESETYQKLVFNSLVASSSTFPAGSSVNLTADVTGTLVEYSWAYNSGTIEGGGDQVVYSNLIPGTYKVLCTVIDAAGEVDSKEIWLTVE